MKLTAAFADQELVTVLSKPAFWEAASAPRARCTARSDRRRLRRAQRLRRHRHARRLLRARRRRVRASVAKVAPFDLTRPHAETLVAAPGREDLLDGVCLEQLVETMVKPVRLITDRNGKGWRSYASLACCDVVGGDSRKFAEWLAMPEQISRRLAHRRRRPKTARPFAPRRPDRAHRLPMPSPSTPAPRRTSWASACCGVRW